MARFSNKEEGRESFRVLLTISVFKPVFRETGRDKKLEVDHEKNENKRSFKFFFFGFDENTQAEDVSDAKTCQLKKSEMSAKDEFFLPPDM